MNEETLDPAPPSIDALDVSDDIFLGGALRIWQPIKGFRTGIDGLYLAASLAPASKMKIFEAGCGAGVVSLALLKRLPHARVTGLEIDPTMVRLATHNAKRNGLEHKAQFIEGNIAAPFQILKEKGLHLESFTHVIANPPYYAPASFRPAQSDLKRKAHMNETGHLENWIKTLTALAQPKGQLTLIHRADHLDQLLSLLKGRFGNLIIFPIFSKKSEPAKRIIIQGIKGSKTPPSLMKGIVLYDEKGKIRQKAARLSKEPSFLDLSVDQ